jgi:hypothetical protein
LIDSWAARFDDIDDLNSKRDPEENEKENEVWIASIPFLMEPWKLAP